MEYAKFTPKPYKPPARKSLNDMSKPPISVPPLPGLLEPRPVSTNNQYNPNSTGSLKWNPTYLLDNTQVINDPAPNDMSPYKFTGTSSGLENNTKKRKARIASILDAGQAALSAAPDLSSDLLAKRGLRTSSQTGLIERIPLETLTLPTPANGYAGIAQSVVSPTNNQSTGKNPLEAIRTGITKLESDGNYQARSKSSSGGGRYQYLEKTWGGYGGFKNAADAPPELQDKKFNKDMGDFLKRYSNDYEAASIAWFQGQSVADRYAKGDKSVLLKTDANGKTTGSYAKQSADIARAYLSVSNAPVGNRKPGERNPLAVSTYDEFTKLGFKVDGFAVSAQHHLVNPNSKHETKDAVDIATQDTDGSVVTRLIAEGNANNIIHNNLIYSKKNGYKPRYYGGAFPNGQKKDDHKNHVHVDY